MVAGLSQYLLTRLCGRKFMTAHSFEVNCGLHGFGKFGLVVLFNLVLLAIIRNLINGLFLVFQLGGWVTGPKAE